MAKGKKAKGAPLKGVFGKMLDPMLKTVKATDAPKPHPNAPHPKAPHPKKPDPQRPNAKTPHSKASRPRRERPRHEQPDDRPPTRTDRIKEHVTDRDLQAARTELDGGSVGGYKNEAKAIRWDHVHEVRDAQNGLSKRIATLKKELSVPTLTTADRAEKQRELAEASRILDHTRKYVP